MAVDPCTPGGRPEDVLDPRSLTRRWIVSALGMEKVSALKPSDVRSLRTAIVDVGKRSTSTAGQAHVVLSMMLDAAKAEKIIRDYPAEAVKKPKGSKVERGAIPTEQALAILRAAAAMPDSAGSRWWFKLLGGPRQGEILGASLDDLDLDARIHEVQWKLEDLQREHGCGDGNCGKKRGADCPSAKWRIPDGFEMRHLTGRWCFTRPKSRTGRVIPLIPQLTEAIRRWLDAIADWPNPHGLIWRNPGGLRSHPGTTRSSGASCLWPPASSPRTRPFPAAPRWRATGPGTHRDDPREPRRRLPDHRRNRRAQQRSGHRDLPAHARDGEARQDGSDRWRVGGRNRTRLVALTHRPSAMLC